MRTVQPIVNIRTHKFTCPLTRDSKISVEEMLNSPNKMSTANSMHVWADTYIRTYICIYINECKAQKHMHRQTQNPKQGLYSE